MRHLPSLISIFVIHCLDRIIPLVFKSCQTWSDTHVTLKTGILTTEFIRFKYKTLSLFWKHIHPKLFVCLLDLMLYAHSKQLRSCWDGQLSKPPCSWTSLLKAVNQHLAYMAPALLESAEEKNDRRNIFMTKSS